MTDRSIEKRPATVRAPHRGTALPEHDHVLAPIPRPRRASLDETDERFGASRLGWLLMLLPELDRERLVHAQQDARSVRLGGLRAPHLWVCVVSGRCHSTTPEGGTREGRGHFNAVGRNPARRVEETGMTDRPWLDAGWLEDKAGQGRSAVEIAADLGVPAGRIRQAASSRGAGPRLTGLSGSGWCSAAMARRRCGRSQRVDRGWCWAPHDVAVFGGDGSQTLRSVTAGGPVLVAVGTDGGAAAVWIRW